MTGSGPRVSWIVGGSLLVASAVLGVVVGPTGYSGSAWLDVVARGSFSVSLLVFAFGIPDGGSVTARRPVGTTALVFLVAWMLVSPLVWTLPFDPSGSPASIATLSFLDQALRLGAAAISVVAVARANVVPAPWRWAPTWALAVVAAYEAAFQVVGVAAPVDLYLVMAVLAPLGTVVTVGAPVFLGIVAIVLAQRPRPSRPVEIYPSSSSPFG